MTSPKQSKPFDPTKPVQTRDGRKARIIATDLNHRGGCPIVAAITDLDGHESVSAFASDGIFTPDFTHRTDLINTPTKREGWIAISREPAIGRRIYRCSDVHMTESDAVSQMNFRECTSDVNYQTIRIEVEEP